MLDTHQRIDQAPVGLGPALDRQTLIALDADQAQRQAEAVRDRLGHGLRPKTREDRDSHGTQARAATLFGHMTAWRAKPLKAWL